MRTGVPIDDFYKKTPNVQRFLLAGMVAKLEEEREIEEAKAKAIKNATRGRR